MKTVARYTWSKNDSGYGWVPWQPPQLTIEREGQSGYWDVYEGYALKAGQLTY
jgi:hypothetical protein